MEINVLIRMDPHIFEGLTVAEMNRKAKTIINQKFAGNVIGIENRAFVNGDSVNEILHPSKSIDFDIRTAKLTAASELDNLLDAGIALPNEPDGRDGHVHPDTIDFSYFKTIFKVGTEYFTGIVNIKNIKRGKLLKDITKIRNITQDIVSSYGTNPKSNFLRDVSMNSIDNSNPVVNTQNSIRKNESSDTISGNSSSISDLLLTDEPARGKLYFPGDIRTLNDVQRTSLISMKTISVKMVLITSKLTSGTLMESIMKFPLLLR